MAARVTVLFFATARVAVGTARIHFPVARNGLTARSLIRALASSYPKLAPTLRASRFVLNGEYLSSLATPVRPGDEFAVHPPYGGG